MQQQRVGRRTAGSLRLVGLAILAGMIVSGSLAGCRTSSPQRDVEIARASRAAQAWVRVEPGQPTAVSEGWDSETVFVGRRYVVFRYAPDEETRGDDTRSLEVVVDLDSGKVVTGGMGVTMLGE